MLVKRLLDGFVQKLSTDLIKRWFPRTTLYKDLSNELKQSLGEPLSEEQLRLCYAKDNLPKVYRMDFNKEHKSTKEQDELHTPLETEEGKTHLSSTTPSQKESILSLGNGTSDESRKDLS